MAVTAAVVYAGNLTEPKTGKSFMGIVSQWGKDWAATGTALRTTSKVQAYAMAFYLEKAGGSVALEPWKTVDGKIDVSRAQKDRQFFDAIINCECGRGVELVFLPDIDPAMTRADVLRAAGDELESRFGIKPDDPSVTADMDKLAEFLSSNVAAGNKLTFHVSKKGSLAGSGVSGSLIVKNTKVAKALLGSWLRNDPNAPELNRNLVANINSIYNP